MSDELVVLLGRAGLILLAAAHVLAYVLGFVAVDTALVVAAIALFNLALLELVVQADALAEGAAALADDAAELQRQTGELSESAADARRAAERLSREVRDDAE